VHKVLVANLHIGSYSVLLVLALFAGYLLARWRAVRTGVKGSHIDNLILLIALASLFGARFFSWLFYFPPGSSFWRAMTSSGGGMVFYGGLIFGIAVVLLYARIAKLALGNLLDCCAAPVALGLAIGRVGCFLAGCCWGDLCVSDAEIAKLPSSQLVRQVRTIPAMSSAGFPLAVTFPQSAGAYEQHAEFGLLDRAALRSQPVHPVQLYEAALAFLLCAALHWRFRRRRWHGEVAVQLAFGYSAIRFATEFLRADNPAVYFGLTLSQMISLVIAALAMIIVICRRKIRRRYIGLPNDSELLPLPLVNEAAPPRTQHSPRSC
jgi:phosphatidylglycerol:prolipoprotein diacylglycerol transferase